MRHCMMNNNMNNSSNMEINEQAVDNGSLWEAEPIVVLPPGSNNSSASSSSSTTSTTTTTSTSSGSSAQSGSTASSSAHSQTSNNMMQGGTMTRNNSGGTQMANNGNMSTPMVNRGMSNNNNMPGSTMTNMSSPGIVGNNRIVGTTQRGAIVDSGISAALADQAPAQTLNVSTMPRAMDTSYLPGYLQQHLGKYVQIYFVVGTQTSAERDGILNEIGSNFLVIREVGSNRLIVCDLYSVKFVNVYDLREEDLRVL